MTDLIGTAYHLEYRFQHKEGRYRWFQDRFTISRNAEGLPLARIGSVRDITEQKTAEMALRESEANVLALFNTTEESIFLLAADETLLALNDVAAQRMGHSRESLIGCRALEMVPSDVVARRRPFIDLALTTGRHVSFEDERNGRWMVNHLHPICDSDGRVVRLAVYSRDITERKQMEDALHKALDDIRTLRGILPICMGCKRIRDDQGYWNEVEVYVRDHTEAEFSHGFCPKCLKRLYPEYDTGDGTGGCIS